MTELPCRCSRCPPSGSIVQRICRHFRFSSAADIEPADGLIGQQRAFDAIAFGTRIGTPGFNLFVIGPSGLRMQRPSSEFLPKPPASADARLTGSTSITSRMRANRWLSNCRRGGIRATAAAGREYPDWLSRLGAKVASATGPSRWNFPDFRVAHSRSTGEPRIARQLVSTRRTVHWSLRYRR